MPPSNLDIAIEGLDDVRRFTATLAGQMPYASMLALNRTAYKVREIAKTRVQTVFDRPTPFTVEGALYEKATKTKLRSRFFFRDEGHVGGDVATYMATQIEGGQRPQKRAEKLLERIGVLRPGEVIAPIGIPLNQYGNVPGSQWSKMITDLGANIAVSQTSTIKRGYFYAEIGGRRAIWYRLSGKLTLAFGIYSNTFKYKRLYPWDAIFRQSEGQILPFELDRAIDDALKTAR